MRRRNREDDRAHQERAADLMETRGLSLLDSLQAAYRKDHAHDRGETNPAPHAETHQPAERARRTTRRG